VVGEMNNLSPILMLDKPFARSLRTTRSSVLLLQHQALRAWTVSEQS